MAGTDGMDPREIAHIESFAKRWQSEEGMTANEAKAKFSYSMLEMTYLGVPRELVEARMVAAYDLIDRVYKEGTH